MRTLGLVLLFMLIIIPSYSNAEIMEDIKNKAEQGDSEAQYFLARIYEYGVEEGFIEYQKAFHWYTEAAEQGHLGAQKNLALMHSHGAGAPQHYKKAFHWFTKAAEQGDAEAQYNLALMYSRGEGTPQHYKKAFHWYTKAAEQGHTSAQESLGHMYRKGEGIPKNLKMAFVWFNLSGINGGDGSLARNRIAKELSPKILLEAQDLSIEYYEKYGKNFP